MSNPKTTDADSLNELGSPSRWLVYRVKGEAGARVVEVRDTMECIKKPGDFGWVSPVNKDEWIPPTGSTIADFEQLFPTRAAAVAWWVGRLKTKIEEYASELKRWETANDPHQRAVTGGIE